MIYECPVCCTPFMDKLSFDHHTALHRAQDINNEILLTPPKDTTDAIANWRKEHIVTKTSVDQSFEAFYEKRRKTEDFTGAKGYEEFCEAVDELAKGVGAKTYRQYLDECSDSDDD